MLGYDSEIWNETQAKKRLSGLGMVFLPGPEYAVVNCQDRPCVLSVDQPGPSLSEDSYVACSVSGPPERAPSAPSIATCAWLEGHKRIKQPTRAFVSISLGGRTRSMPCRTTCWPLLS